MSVRWPDVDHPRTSSGWSWPANLLAAQGPASWPRGRRPASEAEEILADAVAWWDVERSGFRDGDRWLRNLGQAGGVLDLRLGSSLLANSNDPKWLGPESSGYVYLPGVNVNYLTVPDENALDVTGDIDIRALVGMDSWTPAAESVLLAKEQTITTRSYRLTVNSTGNLVLGWSADGSTVVTATSTAAVGLPAGAVKWVRATLQVNNGASGRDVKFFTSDDGSSWSQLGSTVTQAGVTSIFASTSQVEIGTRLIGTTGPLSGRVYRAQVLSGIDGTLVLDVDCDAITTGSATSFTCATGQTVTINRATSGRKSVAMPARRLGGRACMSLGSDDYMEVRDSQQHGLLGFGQGDSFTALVAIRQWANSANVGPYLNKWNSTIANQPGWFIGAASATAPVQGRYGDGATAILTSAVTGSYGILQVGTLAVNRTAQTLTTTANTTTSAATSTRGMGSPRNAFNVMVGKRSAEAGWQDFEFRAAAVWRRPLTTREISVLANSGIWGT